MRGFIIRSIFLVIFVRYFNFCKALLVKIPSETVIMKANMLLCKPYRI